MTITEGARFVARMAKAHVVVEQKSLTSDVPVDVTMGGGTIKANGLQITDDGARILFLNGVKARFRADAEKGDQTPMIARRLALPAALALCLLGLPALAQDKNAGKPTDIEANKMEIIDAEKKAIFTGSVNAKRGDVTLKSDKLVVYYDEVKQPDGTSKTDATNLEATGSVIIKTKKETITGDWAKINPKTNKLVVGGNVKLVQGATVLTGPELRADLDTNKVEMLGGRVKGSFLPN